jgi:NAD(P)-dependent dehydrogenase (short-subunit alcohol dehydrogenase family)
MRSVADQVNALGSFDAIIHNAAVGYREPRRVETEDGFAHVFAINSLAPYVLTAEAQHRFADFTDDLVTWAIFWGPEGGESA